MSRKIGILVWQLDIKGGTQRQALELAQFLRRADYTVTIYTYVYDKAQCYPDLCEGLDIRYVKLHKDIDKADYPVTKLEYFYKYFMFFLGVKHRELLALIDPETDLLNPHDHGTYVTAGMWRRQHQKPVVWMMNDMALYRWNLSHTPKTIGYYLRSAYRQYINELDEIIVLDYLNQRSIKENFGRDAKVIRSGLDLNKFPFRLRSRNGKCRILMTSVLFPHRKVEDAVRALRILLDRGHDVSIEHVGTLVRDPKYTQRVKKLIEKLNVKERFTFNGSVSEEELHRFYNDLDIYLFPNSPQTWGLSVFEAMTAGMPVVLTKGCGASEVLTHRENAMIMSPDSPEQLADAIEELMQNKDLSEGLTKRARKFVENNISWERYSSEMLEVFKTYLRP